MGRNLKIKREGDLKGREWSCGGEGDWERKLRRAKGFSTQLQGSVHMRSRGGGLKPRGA